jgi:hypothetical protein
MKNQRSTRQDLESALRKLVPSRLLGDGGDGKKIGLSAGSVLSSYLLGLVRGRRNRASDKRQ